MVDLREDHTLSAGRLKTKFPCSAQAPASPGGLCRRPWTLRGRPGEWGQGARPRLHLLMSGQERTSDHLRVSNTGGGGESRTPVTDISDGQSQAPHTHRATHTPRDREGPKGMVHTDPTPHSPPSVGPLHLPISPMITSMKSTHGSVPFKHSVVRL